MIFRDFSSKMKKAKSGRKKRSVTDKRITGPDLCRMIAQERFPALSIGAFWANLLHILLDGPFTHPNIQLEELTPNALRSPEPIVGCYLLDQGDRFG
jgi:hypothetical protein